MFQGLTPDLTSIGHCNRAEKSQVELLTLPTTASSSWSPACTKCPHHPRPTAMGAPDTPPQTAADGDQWLGCFGWSASPRRRCIAAPASCPARSCTSGSGPSSETCSRRRRGSCRRWWACRRLSRRPSSRWPVWQSWNPSRCTLAAVPKILEQSFPPFS